MIKIDYIREFVILAETLSFSKTAELTYVTQPALTRHIAALEEELGGKLLYRNTRNVSLTPAGEAAYEPLCALLTNYMTIKEQTISLSAGKQGVLRISSPYYWTEDFMEPGVELFMEDHPDAEVQIFSCQPPEGMQDIMSGKSDILLYMKILDVDDHIRYASFAKERFAVVCLKDSHLAKYDSLFLEQIHGEQIISFDFENSVFSGYNRHLLALMAKRCIYPKDFLIAQQVDTVGISLRKHGGISILPYGLRHMDRSYLKFLPLMDEDCLIDMCLYYRTDNDNPLISQFVRAAVTANRPHPVIQESFLQIRQ